MAKTLFTATLGAILLVTGCSTMQQPLAWEYSAKQLRTHVDTPSGPGTISLATALASELRTMTREGWEFIDVEASGSHGGVAVFRRPKSLSHQSAND